MGGLNRGHPQPKMKIHSSRSAKGTVDRGGREGLIWEFYARGVALSLFSSKRCKNILPCEPGHSICLGSVVYFTQSLPFMVQIASGYLTVKQPDAILFVQKSRRTICPPLYDNAGFQKSYLLLTLHSLNLPLLPHRQHRR